MARIPFLNRVLPAIDELQQETAALLHRPDALALSVLDAARVVVAVTAFWLILEGWCPDESVGGRQLSCWPSRPSGAR
jgi:hypothetical protein